MPKPGSVAVPPLPSLTEIDMLLYEPVCALVGVPESCPVEATNVAHAGRLAIENDSASPFGSEAVGRNEYAVPTRAVVGGEPEIVGAPLVEPEPDARTVSANAGSEAEVVPLLAVM